VFIALSQFDLEKAYQDTADIWSVMCPWINNVKEETAGIGPINMFEIIQILWNAEGPQ
jgi:hypothetical protein